MMEKRPLSAWLRPLAGIFALVGVLGLTACGGGSGAPNNPYAPGPVTPAALAVLPATLTAYAGTPATLTISGGFAALPRVFERHLRSAGEPRSVGGHDRPPSGPGRLGRQRDGECPGLGRHDREQHRYRRSLRRCSMA